MSDARRALVVGATSCAGRHLAAALVAAGWDLVGTRRAGGASADGLPAGMRLVPYEAGDGSSLRALLTEVRPTTVFFLLSAGRSDVLEAMLAVGVRGLAVLCEAMLASGQSPVVVAVSSSAVYGTYAGTQPLGEGAARRPVGPYGLGKALAEDVGWYYARRHGLPIRIARAFNHPGPGERPGLAVTDYARRIIAIERGDGAPRLVVQHPTNIRDFVDVRDVVRGYLRLAELGRDGEAYNFCSGVGTGLGDVVARLAAHSPTRIEVVGAVQVGPSNAQVGDPEKAERELGWTREVPLDRTLGDLLAFERANR